MRSTPKSWNTPRFTRYLSRQSARKFGMSATTHARYKRGILPPEIADLMATHPLAAFDLTVDFIESAAGALPPQLAALLDLTRREIASALAAAELPDSLKIAA